MTFRAALELIKTFYKLLDLIAMLLMVTYLRDHFLRFVFHIFKFLDQCFTFHLNLENITLTIEVAKL